MSAPKMMSISVALMGAVALSGCGGYDRDITLRKIRNPDKGPDEFTIVPGKELQSPTNDTELPPPTPQGSNRTDINPKADAVAALGGRPSALENRGVGSGDGALVAAASRKGGVDPSIRVTLAEEDEDFRRRKSRWTRWRIFGSDEYYEAYKKQSIDPTKTQRRWRRAGAPTPSAPPVK